MIEKAAFALENQGKALDSQIVTVKGVIPLRKRCTTAVLRRQTKEFDSALTHHYTRIYTRGLPR